MPDYRDYRDYDRDRYRRDRDRSRDRSRGRDDRDRPEVKNYINFPSRSSRSHSRSRTRSRPRDEEDRAEMRRWRSKRLEDDAVADFKRQQDEEHRKIQEAIKEHEIEEEKQKERDKEIVDKWQAEQKRKAEEKKRIAEEYEREQKEKKEKADKEYKERMSKDLSKFGFKENQVEAIISNKATSTAMTKTATLPKVRIDYLEERTLIKSKVPYHRDELDPNFWCIDTPITDEFLQKLFQHTKRIRHEREEKQEKLLLEDTKHHGHGHGHAKEKQVEFVRRARSKSRNREKSRDRGKSRDREDLTGPEKLVANLFLR